MLFRSEKGSGCETIFFCCLLCPSDIEGNLGETDLVLNEHYASFGIKRERAGWGTRRFWDDS